MLIIHVACKGIVLYEDYSQGILDKNANKYEQAKTKYDRSRYSIDPCHGFVSDLPAKETG